MGFLDGGVVSGVGDSSEFKISLQIMKNGVD
jgi:hypothetical protein